MLRLDGFSLLRATRFLVPEPSALVQAFSLGISAITRDLGNWGGNQIVFT